MGFWKEIMRDFAERNLTQHEIDMKRAREAEAEGDWSTAVFWYEHLGEWEKAGDIYYKLSQGGKGVGYLGPAGSLRFAIDSYDKGGHALKMVAACVNCLSTSEGLYSSHLEKLKEKNLIQALLQEVFRTHPGRSFDDRKSPKLGALFWDLLRLDEPVPAADLLLHFRETLLPHYRDVITNLVKIGRYEKAMEIFRALVTDRAVDGRDAQFIAGVFTEAQAYKQAEEVFRTSFTIDPSGTVRQGAEILAGSEEWRDFLSYALKENPLKLGEALRHIESISSPDRHTGGELEADFLLQCYDVVGPQSLRDDKEGTTHWLYALTEFWKARGDKAREAELRYRCAEDKKRLGFVHLFSGYDYAWAAWAFADKQEFNRAAEAMEKAALTDHSLPRHDPNFGFWYQGAKLYEKAENREKAAELYDQCGQSAKASRLRGMIRHDANEAGTVVEALNVPRDSKDWILKKAEELVSDHAAEDAAGSLLQELEKEKGGMWEDWFVVPVLYKRSKNNAAYRETLRQMEIKFRNRGRWVFAAKVYLFEELYDEFDRLCQEEDELEVAALWYEQAKMPERAAKIYDLMGRGGKSGKAQSEGAKQKPQDAVKPKPESAEEAKGEDFDQPVCAQCGAEIKPHWTVCPKCDGDLQHRKCRNCGEPLEQDWKRCPVCQMVVAPSH